MHVKKRKATRTINPKERKPTSYLHHSPDPKAAIDGVDPDDGPVGVLQNSVEEPQVICQHYNDAGRN